MIIKNDDARSVFVLDTIVFCFAGEAPFNAINYRLPTIGNTVVFCYVPIPFMIFRTDVCEKQELVNIQSAMWLTPIENSHMARYGSADRKPFYGEQKKC